MFLAATRRGAVACAHAAKRGTNEWQMKLLPVAQLPELPESAAKRDNSSSSSRGTGGGGGSVKPANIAGKNTALLIPNVSSRSMESGSSCCRCCSYACCSLSLSPLLHSLSRCCCWRVPPPSLTLSLHLFLRSLTASRLRFLSQLFGDLFILFSILPRCSVATSPPSLSAFYPLFCPAWHAATDALRPALVAGKITRQQQQKIPSLSTCCLFN